MEPVRKKRGDLPSPGLASLLRIDLRDFTVAAERSAGVEGFQIIYITLYGVVYSEC